MGNCLGSASKEQAQQGVDRTSNEKGMEIKGSVAIITGAARGLGRAFAEGLLDRGAKVCVADIDTEKGQETVSELQAKHGEDRVIFFTCNVTSDDDFKGAWDATAEKLGPVNLLINNAGIGNEQDWNKTIAVNLGGCMRGTLMALDRMGTNKGGAGGVVVNIGSIAAVKNYPFGPVYSSTKSGIVGLTRSLGCDFHLKISGVKVQTLCPALVKTELLVNSFKTAFSPEVSAAMSKFTGAVKDMSAERVACGLVKLLEEGRNGGCLVVEAEKDPYYVDAPVLS